MGELKDTRLQKEEFEALIFLFVFKIFTLFSKLKIWLPFLYYEENIVFKIFSYFSTAKQLLFPLKWHWCNPVFPPLQNLLFYNVPLEKQQRYFVVSCRSIQVPIFLTLFQ